MSASEENATRDPLDRLAEAFLERFRRGERPSLTEYVMAHPELADDIRDLFPALVEMERIQGTGEVGLAAPARARQALSRLGDYQILGIIGEGGMGIVYEAMRESLRSRVALKVMHPHYRDRDNYLRRFHVEARAAARLHHTNIVSVFDYGEADGVVYYAMPFIAGHSLEVVLEEVRRLRGEGVEPGLEVTRQASALAMGLVTGRFAATEILATGQVVPDAVRSTPPDPGGEVLTKRNAPPPTPPYQGGEPEFAPPLDKGGLGGVRSAIPSSVAPPLDKGGLGGVRSMPTLEREAPGTSNSSHPSSSLADKSDTRYHREVARLGAQVADALAYAHKRGILHRDIKPSNLLLDAMGNIWVTDFGLAKFEEGEDLSQSHDLLGTLRYMAPERFRGVSDRRCDLYALGATLYEMLTLHPAFEAPDQARLIQRIMNESPVSPRRLDRNVPRDLETIVLKALAKEPRDRFATADELADELRRFAENRPIRSRTTPTYERAWRWCRRNPGFATLTAAVALLIVALGLGGTIAAYVYRAQRDDTEQHLGRAVRAERRANVALGESLLAEGAALQRTSLVGQRFDSLERLARAARILGADTASRARLPEIRNHAIAALGLTDLREVWRRPIALTHGIRMDSAARRYAAFEPPEIVIRSLADDGVLRRLPALDFDHAWYAWMEFSPDGDWLAVSFGLRGGGNQLRLWHLTGQEPPRDLPAHGSSVAFPPDGRRLVYGPPEGGLAVWDLAAGQRVRTFPLEFAPQAICTDPGGSRVAVNNTDATAPRLVVLDLETGRVLSDPRADIGIGQMAWSADGRLLAVGGHNDDPRVYVREMPAGKLVSVLRGHAAQIVMARFAHAGHLLATSSWDDTTRLWDAVSGELLVTVPGMDLWGFTPDDRGLVLGGRLSVELRELAAGNECRTLHPGLLGNRSEARDMAGIQGADISPDGRLLATSGGAGVRLWDLGTGRELVRLEAGNCPTVLFQPDGSSLITRGHRGVHRWPIQNDSGRDAGRIRIGPPILLREPEKHEGWYTAAWLPDGRTLALPLDAVSRVLLVDATHPHAVRSRPRTLESGVSRMTSVAASPDGRYLALGMWRSNAIQILDLSSQKSAALLAPIPGSADVTCSVRFSPDGRWLAASASSYVAEDGYRVWETGTWKLARRIDEERHGRGGTCPAFTRDGRIMALAIAPDQIQLADAATGHELARLTTLRSITPVPLAFSPNGTKLVASTREKTVLIWDLSSIRSQLAGRNLDWDEVSRGREPAAPPPIGASDALSVTVVGEAIEPSAWRAAERTQADRRLNRDPEDAEALALRGWIALRDGKVPEAIANLEHRLRLGPDPDALFGLAEAYERAQRPAEAAKCFGQLLEAMPDDHDLRNRRAQAALDAGQYALAIDDDTRLLAAHGQHGNVLYRRSWCLYQLGRYPEALRDLDTLVARDADNRSLYELRAFARAALGDRRGAEADRKKAARLPPRDALGQNNLAWDLVKAPSCSKEDAERALAFARRAVALEPENPFYLNTLGTALYRASLPAEAVSVLEHSLTLHTDLPPAFDLIVLAMVHHRMGHRAEARGCFDRALRWHREHPKLPPAWAAELEAFEVEARALLRPEPLPDLPRQVFAQPSEN